MPRDQREGLTGVGAGRPRSFVGDLLLVVSVVLPLGVFLVAALEDYARTLAAAERDLLITAETLSGHARNLFRFQALALGATEELLRGIPEAEILAAPARFHERLGSIKRFAGGDLGITVIGADGRPLVDTQRPEPPRGIDLSDRPYFRLHRDDPGTAPHVAAPLRSRVTGDAVFFLTLRRAAPDGGFGGVIAAAIPQSGFIGFWDRTASNPLDAITLIRDDGRLLARRPALDPEVPRWVDPAGVVGRARASGVEGAVFRGASTLDGVDRLYVLRRIEGFPAFLVHGVPYAAVIRPVWARLGVYGLLAAGAAAALLSLALVSRRQARALDRMNAGLERRVEERTAEIQAGEVRLRLLAREVDHRAKNALAVVQATLRLTPRTDIESFAASVEGRVLALARAQTLLAAEQWRGASLRQLLLAELAPFVAREGEGPLVELDGPAVLLPPVATQPLAMLAHELATNAVKHGTLAVPQGRVRISWEVPGDDAPEVGGAALPEGRAGALPRRLRLRWVETGGADLAGPPLRRGFGTRMLESLVRGQLGGTIVMRWEPAGLVCEIDIPLTVEARSAAARGAAAA